MSGFPGQGAVRALWRELLPLELDAGRGVIVCFVLTYDSWRGGAAVRKPLGDDFPDRRMYDSAQRPVDRVFSRLH